MRLVPLAACIEHRRALFRRTLQEARGQKTERKGAANERRRVAPRELLDVVDDLIEILVSKIGGNALDLVRCLVGILRYRDWGLRVLPKLLAHITKRLGRRMKSFRGLADLSCKSGRRLLSNLIHDLAGVLPGLINSVCCLTLHT
jgi:hypothetical protein